MPAGYQAQAPAAAEVRSTPGFAEVHKNHSHFIPQELQEEMGELLVALARQRFFLYFHWLVFLGSHALGFLMAFWCYQEFQGDEVNKIFMSLPPLFFINLAAFFCLPPIKTTRFEISRLKERLTYLHFRIEYRHLL